MGQALRGQLQTPRQMKDYVTAGYATITIRSRKTKDRYTYRIKQAESKRPNAPILWFVELMTGPDNEKSYEYIGQIRDDLSYDHGRKSTISKEDRRAHAFAWFWWWVRQEKAQPLEQVEVWHEGHCGKCGRKLTVPESVASGIGPECAKGKTRRARGRAREVQLGLKYGERPD